MSGIRPIAVDSSVSSLSAILLDDDYYKILLDGKVSVDGFSVLRPEYLLMFKAKAFLDLRQRKEAGEKVDSRDISKHKKDILRIVAELVLEKVGTVPASVGRDIQTFKEILKHEPFDSILLKRYNVTNDDVLTVLDSIL